MNIYEKNIINNIIIFPPECGCDFLIKDNEYLDTDEIASPCKIFKTLTHIYKNKNKCIDYIYKKELLLEIINVPYYKEFSFYDIKIHSDSFHVLTEDMKILQTFYLLLFIIDIDTNIGKELLLLWLIENWNKLIIFTTPFYREKTTADLFMISNQYPQLGYYNSKLLKIYEINKILDRKSYIICNGLTIFLAMHRYGKINKNISEYILKELYRKLNFIIYQKVPKKWESLYYVSNMFQIADFPWYYVCTGPYFAHYKIIKLFSSEAEDIIYINRNNRIIYTSVQSLIFPYFNKNIWQLFDRKNISWLDKLKNTETNDVIIPNISQFIMAILSSRNAWKWFLESSDIIYEIKKNTTYNTYTLLIKILKTCFYLYNYKCCQSDSQYSYHRIRSLWKIVCEKLDYNCVEIPKILHSIIFKKDIYINLKLNDLYSCEWQNIDIPYAFYKDLFDTYKEKLNILVKHRFTILDVSTSILNVIYKSEIQSNKIDRSIFDSMKKSTNQTSEVFYKEYIKKNILFKLLIIKKVFFCSNDHNLYTIGNLLIKYLKNNKEVLIY